MKSVNDFYYNLKQKSDLPITVVNYIIIDDVGYHFGKNVWVDFKNDKDSIYALTKIAERNDFFAFNDSEKGKEFIKENYEGLRKAFLENLYKETEITISDENKKEE